MDTISQYSLHDELHQRLRQMIIDGAFEPGDKIPEKQLCTKFDVSRTPLREALKVLAAEGLVELTPNRGAMVATLTPEEFRDCHPIILALMNQCAELACKEISDDEIAKAQSSLERLRIAHNARDFHAMADECKWLREICTNATRSHLFRQIFDSLLFRMNWKKLVLRLARSNPEIVLSDHDNIVSTLRARHAETFALALRAYITHVFETCSADLLPRDFSEEKPSPL